MKKYIYIAAASLFAFAACEKESGVQEEVTPVEEPEVKELVTITASIPEEGLATKVAFEEEDSGGGKMRLTKLSWEEGDKLTINGETFTVKTGTISVDGKTADFTGTAPGAGPYTISYSSLPGDINNQTQKADGDPEYLGYSIALSGASSYTAFEFSSTGATALGATFTQSSVLQLRAVLPADVASSVKTVIFKSSKDDLFGASNTLKVELENTGTVGSDNTLDIYAALPAGADVTLDDKMDFLIQFQVSDNEYDKYTAYREFPASTHFIIPGRTQYIGINCANIESYANKSNVDIGTSGNPYLIGDQHQMQAISLSTTKQYYKLVDDIDMTGVGWTSLNAEGTKIIDLNGNGKIISNLQSSLFDDLNGTVSDLTISDATIDGGSLPAGILANTIKTSASTVDNVDITNSSITAAAYAGGLICNITKGKTIISNVDITNTNVTGTLTGGIIGFPQESTDITNCHFIGNGITSTPATRGVITANNQYAGGIIGATSAGKTVTISESSVKAAKIVSSYNKVGGAVGHLRSGSSIENTIVGEESNYVIISLTTNGQNVGGFIGLSEGGRVIDCKAYTDITAVANYVGGFIGHMNGGVVTGCESYGAVNGPSYIGGFAGQVSAATTLSGNESHCTIAATGTYVGGFVGRLVGSVSLSNCTHATGAVWSNIGGGTESYVGGFAGYIGSKSEAFTGTISQCYVNRAEVKSVKYAADGTTAESSGSWVGGFAGGIGSSTYANNTGTVQQCGVFANQKTGGQYTGGFAGVSYSTISECRVSGAFKVQGYSASIGGFIGYQQGNSVRYCYTNGTPTTKNKSNVGGFIGQAKNTTIEECYSSGDISGTSATTGGMIGSVSDATMNKLIRWNHSNNATILAGESSVQAGCHVKTSGESNFKTVALALEWSTNGTIWNYPDGGGIPSLINVP